jgi:hypothetical protein
MSAEDISVRNPLLLNGILERAGHVLLPNDLREALRPVFTRQDLVTHAETLIIPLAASRDFQQTQPLHSASLPE